MNSQYFQYGAKILNEQQQIRQQELDSAPEAQFSYNEETGVDEDDATSTDTENSNHVVMEGSVHMEIVEVEQTEDKEVEEDEEFDEEDEEVIFVDSDDEDEEEPADAGSKLDMKENVLSSSDGSSDSGQPVMKPKNSSVISTGLFAARKSNPNSTTAQKNQL